jgi:hypothetical protein
MLPTYLFVGLLDIAIVAGLAKSIAAAGAFRGGRPWHLSDPDNV